MSNGLARVGTVMPSIMTLHSLHSLLNIILRLNLMLSQNDLIEDRFELFGYPTLHFLSIFFDFLGRLDFNLHLCYIASLLLDIPDFTSTKAFTESPGILLRFSACKKRYI